MRIGLWYDFRNPAQWRQDPAKLYAATLEQIAWAETLGFDSIWVSEHHFVDDAYLPSLFPALAAIAARTSRVAIGTNVLLLPLYDPLRVAEDAAVVDLISGGRLELGIGLGWYGAEFKAFGQKLSERAPRFEEGVDLLRRLFTEDRVSHDGRFFKIENLSLQPKPARRPPIYFAANSEPAARRAARLGDGMMALERDPVAHYLDELRTLGREDEAALLGTLPLLIDDDPERAWAQTKEHWLHQHNEYSRYEYSENPDDFVPLRDADTLRGQGDRGGWKPMTPADAVTYIRERTTGLPVKDLHFWAIAPGEPIEASNRRLQVIAEEVLPALR